MLRRFWFLGVGALTLLVGLAAPGQLHAQRMRSFPRGVQPSFRGGFDPRFNRNFFFDPRFNRNFFFDPRFDPRFNRNFFDPRFDPRFSRNFFFDPRFSTGFFSPF
jgi:hypothetical protein